jgi:hypothetical protein
MRRRAKWNSRGGNRGFLLLSSYLVLSLFLVYSGALAIRTISQQVVADRLHNRLQALDLAQAAMEQLREDLYLFFSTEIYQLQYGGDAVRALAWLDALNPLNPLPLDRPFLLPEVQGVVDGPTPLSEASPRRSILPVGSGQAWIVSVTPLDQAAILSPRNVTIEATATVGPVTKRIRATYQIALGVSDIFRYAYFMNNYGWMDVRGTNRVKIFGEVRANGDLDFTSDVVWGGQLPKIVLNGDIYAAANPDLINPITGLPTTGDITGDPGQTSSWDSPWDEYWYDHYKERRTRPTQRLTAASQPAIGGAPLLLPEGQGWESDVPEQKKAEAQPVEDIPYLGNLSLYKDLATEYNSGAGSTLTYLDAGADGIYGNGDDVQRTVSAIYAGPNGTAGDGDDTTPLVLVGTQSSPIVIDGPIVIPGDVIIVGNVSGRGTVYVGRNVHLLGSVIYTDPPVWPDLERDLASGQIRDLVGGGIYSNLGTVCNDGTYFAPGKVVSGGCMQ